MADQTGEGTADQTQVNAQSAGASSPANGDLQVRLNGALAKIQSLTEEGRRKDGTIVELQGQISALHGEHAGEKASLSAVASETGTKLQTALAQIESLKTELAGKDGRLLKLKLIRENGMSGLLDIMDDIPAVSDETAQLEVLKRFAGFAAKVSSARESELVAGVLPTPAQKVTATVPTNSGDWMKFIESLPLGSQERQTAWEAYQKATFAK